MSDKNKQLVAERIVRCVSGLDFEEGVANITLALICLLQIGIRQKAFTTQGALDVLGNIGDNKEVILGMYFSSCDNSTKH